MTSLFRPPALLGLAVLNLSLLALAGCGGKSSSGSSDDDGGNDGPAIQFSNTSTSVQEGVTQVQVFLELDKPGSENIDLNYFTQGGDATIGVDFQIPNPPLTIPAGDVFAIIVMQIFDDGNGEKDETFVLHLIPPINANLGANTQFTTTILDDDATVVNEVEPNDSPADATVAGDIQPLVSYTILGTTLVGAFDMFELTAIETTDVFLFLDPVSAVAEIGLCILDMGGNLIDGPFDASGPGASVSATYKAFAGETFYLSVTVIGSGTDYALDAIGLFPVSAGSGGGPGERTLEARGFMGDLDGLLRWIQAGEQRLELRGEVLLDSRAGTVTRLAPFDR